MQIGHIILFFGRAIAGIPVVLKNYRKEYTRLLSDVAWGNGSLVVGGGTAGVAVVLGIVVGVMVGIEGYKDHHIWHPTAQELLDLAADCGFSLEKTHWQEGTADMVVYVSLRKRPDLSRKK
jgi:hypothetical protein